MIEIVARGMTTAEYERSQLGFDEYSLEMGVAVQNSTRFGFVALNNNEFIGCASGLAYQNGNA